MQTIQTVNDAFLRVSSRASQTVWRWLDPAGQWQPISGAQVYGRVRALAAQLASWGITKGDRVALIAENRWEWPVVDFATLALGAVDVPLYPTLTPDQLGYMLRDSGARVVFVSTAELFRKLHAAGPLPGLEHIVVMDPGDFEGAHAFASLLADAPELETPDPQFDAQLAAVAPNDLATIIYTSGTTGEPKGVVLTHGNLASNFTRSTVPFAFDHTDSCISFLPLSHVTARHLDYALMCDGPVIAYCPKFDYLVGAMKAVRPTIFVSVPRVYERIRQTVEGRAKGTRKKIFTWALRVGASHRATILRGKTPWSPIWRLAHKLVFSKISEAFGGNVHYFISGGAPLGLDLGHWFADAGISILEGYGLTETSPVIALNNPKQHKLGTVGPILPNVEVRLAEDGELEVRGPSVFSGYWNKPEETRSVFTADGWFCTGDIASIDSDGLLSITDRKKELIKTSGGKFIAPQPIENRLKANLLVGNAAMLGDKRKIAAVILSPNFPALESWAAEHQIATSDRTALVTNPAVTAEYRAIVKQVNKTLAPFEQIKRISVVPHEWTIETGELTPSMKLKRRVIEAKYRSEIAELYRDEA